jgi:pectate lyase
MPTRTLALLTAFVLSSFAALPANADEQRALDQHRLDAVRQFADQVLRVGRDTYGDTHTPLFADGVNVDTHKPVVWRFEGSEWIISNFANQQHLMRVLDGLTELTGEPAYRTAAEAATRHMFQHHQDESGLLYWGGHRFIDLRTNTYASGFDSISHELKSTHPYYELMWRVDASATQRMLEAIWNAHVFDWATLDMNRHGKYGLPRGAIWDNRFADPEPFFIGDGLTFINCGSDLVLAAVSLYEHAGDEAALQWGERLAYQYVKARHPQTQLGVYQYSQPEQKRIPTEDADTASGFGDRAKRQFGPEFGDVALEGNVLTPARAFEIYGNVGVMQLTIAEQLGEQGRDLLQWTVDGLIAYAKHAHDPEQNVLRPLLADGTDLSGHVLPRDGYFGKAGTTLDIRKPPFQGVLTVSYARAYRITGDEQLRQPLRHFLRGHKVGDIGASPGSAHNLQLDTDTSDPEVLIALVELHRRESNPAFLKLARRIGDNILEHRFHKGFFLLSKQHINANFDALEPLALLTLEAYIRQSHDAVAPYVGGGGYIHGAYDGHGRTYDRRVIWNLTR